MNAEEIVTKILMEYRSGYYQVTGPKSSSESRLLAHSLELESKDNIFISINQCVLRDIRSILKDADRGSTYTYWESKFSKDRLVEMLYLISTNRALFLLSPHKLYRDLAQCDECTALLP